VRRNFWNRSTKQKLAFNRPDALQIGAFKLTGLLKITCTVVFCFILLIQNFALPAAVAASDNTPNASPDENNYILDRTITWADGTIECVQIDNEKFIHLDGVKRKLVGVVLHSGSMPYGRWGEFYLPENMALYDKELDYLESTGVRVIHTNLMYVRCYTNCKSIENERKAYVDYLDLLYQHKMLVIPEINYKGDVGFNNLEVIKFSWTNYSGQPDSIEQWALRWGKIVGGYSNVIGVVAEGEMDCLTETDRYPAQAVREYMTFLVNTLQVNFDGPIICKLMGTEIKEPEIKKASLSAVDFGGFDCYATTVAKMDSRLNQLHSQLTGFGYPTTGWWCLESNAGHPIDINNFKSELIETIFAHGATVVTIFAANWVAEPTWQLFDTNGDPVPAMVQLAKDFDRLQTPVTEQPSYARFNQVLNSTTTIAQVDDRWEYISKAND